MKTFKFYAAYGMNTNLQQMAYRCPNAIAVGRMDLPGYKFCFRGVADVYKTNRKSDKVTCAIWKITEECEWALDRLEGFPSFYTKQYITMNINGKQEQVMIYEMTKKNKSKIYDPSESYWKCLHEGYEQFGIPHKQMYDGLPMFSHYKSYKQIKWQRRYDNKKAALWRNINS